MKKYADLQAGLQQLTLWSLQEPKDYPTLEAFNEHLDDIGHGLNYPNITLGTRDAIEGIQEQLIEVIENDTKKVLDNLKNQIASCKVMAESLESLTVNHALVRKAKEDDREWYTNLSLVNFNKGIYDKAIAKLEVYAHHNNLPSELKLTCGTTHIPLNGKDGYGMGKYSTIPHTLKARRINSEGISIIKESLNATVASGEKLYQLVEEVGSDWLSHSYGTKHVPAFITSEPNEKMAVVLNGAKLIGSCMVTNSNNFSSIVEEMSV